MGKLLHDWKGYMAKEANKLLCRKGRFWQKDYWDTYMRDTRHEICALHYIENNPVKAGLAPSAAEWPWSSARFRDKFGMLQIPLKSRED